MCVTDEEPCEFCGTQEMSNTMLGSEPTIEYLDGPARASVTGAVLCYDCAQDVSDYIESRKIESPEDVHGPSPFGETDEEAIEGLYPFGEKDAEAILDRLQENEHLVMEMGRSSGYGVRAIDGEWKRAVFFAPGPRTIKNLTRDEVRRLVLDAKRLTIKHLDSEGWRRYE